VRLRTIVWAALLGLALAAALHSTALVFATLAAALLTALVVATRRSVFRAFSFTRTPDRRVVGWGGRLEVTVSVTNAKLLPLVWLRLRDDWPLGLEPHGFALEPARWADCQRLTQTLSLRWYERLRRHYRVDCRQRGQHWFGPATLEAGDPFGITGVVSEVKEREPVLVLPKVLTVEGLELITGRPLVESAALRSLARDPVELRGTRPYRPGDPLRSVNWRATARTGELHTDESEPTSLAAVRLLLDVGVYQHAWQGVDPERVELLCAVTASLASAFADGGHAVGLASNALLAGCWRAVDLEPAEGALDEVLETLARVIVLPPDDFARVLAAEADDEAQTADRVIVTPALRAPARAELARLRAWRPAVVVFVGKPTAEERALVDAVVPPDFDWRSSSALPLAR
jgi:uncharacterized protein (DUF58 family)